jgi:hypothetical protein
MSSEQTTSTPEQPTVITLDATNSAQILTQYVDHAQQKGAYLLNEAELLKRASDLLVNNVVDHEINVITARQLLIQGIHKGQRHGAYTLNDAALLHKVVSFVQGLIQSQVQNIQGSTESTPIVENSADDLSDLAEPIPLKPKEV